jgi:toxin ParE1/3/4
VRVTYREAAQTDLIRQFRYYLVTLELPRVALRFREAVKRTAKELSRHPNIATPCRVRNPELQSLRCWPVHGFEAMRRYFLAEDGAMRVIRILHGKQDVRRILERERLSE